MAGRVPASPSLSPGRRLFRAVPPSPALGYRAPGTASAPGSALAARHTKSTSDLSQAQQSRYDPSRIIGGGATLQSAVPALPPVSPRESQGRAPESNSGSLGARTYTPYAPTQALLGASVMRSASPSSGSCPPPRQQRTVPSSALSAAAPRGSSAERRPPQWTPTPTASKPWAAGFSTAWTSPRQVAPLAQSAGSQIRSQSSQGRRTDAFSPRVPPAQALDKSAQDHGSRSPNPQSTRRAPSFQHLQGLQASTVAGIPTNGVKPATVPITVSEEMYEAQMTNLRNSLLQHIQSVQKEISRLQLERQRAQVPGQERTPTNSASAGTVSEVSTTTSQARVATTSTTTTITTTASTRSPHSSSRNVSAERGRGSDRFHDKLSATKDRELQPVAVCQAASPTKSNSNPGDGFNPVVQNAASRIQRFWRRMANARQKLAPSTPLRSSRVDSAPMVMDSQSKTRRQPFPVHHSAARIQRAWRVSRWRRKFVEFSEREIGWVGTLDWLQHHNHLYGTELADPEDTRWWAQQRANAPLDRHVDPWGCTKLRDHLNRMWYGRTTEELQESERDQRYEEACLAERDQRYEEAYMNYGNMQQDVYVLYEASQPWGGEPAIGPGQCLAYGSEGQARSIRGAVPSTIRSQQSAERAVALRPVPSMSGAGKATSLSPRRETQWMQSEVVGRSKGAAMGAPPPSSLHSYQSPPQTHRAPRVPQAVPQAAVGVTSTFRPRSPVQSHGMQGALQTGRLSLAGSNNGGTTQRATVTTGAPPVHHRANATPTGLARPLSGSRPRTSVPTAASPTAATATAGTDAASAPLTAGARRRR